jgi:hypothetical protein
MHQTLSKMFIPNCTSTRPPSTTYELQVICLMLITDNKHCRNQGDDIWTNHVSPAVYIRDIAVTKAMIFGPITSLQLFIFGTLP